MGLIDIRQVVKATNELAIQPRQINVVADFLRGSLLQSATDLRFHDLPAPVARARRPIRCMAGVWKSNNITSNDSIRLAHAILICCDSHTGDSKMKFKHIETFRVVMLTRSMTLAAGELHTSQSNISRVIGQLEAATGFRLFDRRPGGL